LKKYNNTLQLRKKTVTPLLEKNNYNGKGVTSNVLLPYLGKKNNNIIKNNKIIIKVIVIN